MKRCRSLHKDVRCIQVKVDVSIWVEISSVRPPSVPGVKCKQKHGWPWQTDVSVASVHTAVQPLSSAYSSLWRHCSVTSNNCFYMKTDSDFVSSWVSFLLNLSSRMLWFSTYFLCPFPALYCLHLCFICSSVFMYLGLSFSLFLSVICLPPGIGSTPCLFSRFCPRPLSGLFFLWLCILFRLLSSFI